MKKEYKYFFVLLLLFIIIFAFTNKRVDFFSDESSYFSITQSIAHDFDLEFNKKDIYRIRKLIPFSGGPMGIFLKKTAKNKIYYAKSFAYPLFAALFLLIFGTPGILIFNGILLWFMILMAYYLLKQYHSEENSFYFSICFFLCSITPLYLWWMQPSIFDFFCIFTGLFFMFYEFKKRPKFVYLAPVFFSIAVFSKPSNVFTIAVIFLIFLLNRDWKKFIVFSIISIVVTSGFFMINYLHTGEINYQGGDRRSFHKDYPFEKDDFKFDSNKTVMSSDRHMDHQTITPQVVVLNLFYYVFGRFTGFFIYFFPAFFILAFFFFQKKTREDIILLISICVGILFFAIVTPNNYFGGSGSVGNRYFFAVFPLFFYMGYKNRNFRFLKIIPLIAIIFLTAPFINSSKFSTSARWAGVTFPNKLFPPEKTQYNTLPTNESSWAWGKHLSVDGKSYRLYFLDFNAHYIRENTDYFRTRSTRKTELFLRTPKKLKKLTMVITNQKENNVVRAEVEDVVRRLRLNAKQVIELDFENIKGLWIDNSWIYHIKVKSKKDYIPLHDIKNNGDAEIYGVQVKLKVEY